MNISYSKSKTLPRADVLALYKDAGWTEYTKDISTLMAGIEQSLAIVSAWHENRLIGLVRIVGDGETIVYIQDLLVLQTYQHSGIGSSLLTKVINDFKHVRQLVLLTDDEPAVRSFYKKHAFTSCDQGSLVAFAKLNHVER
ncbi:GNAT family N-acetyltransferase [Geomicrobium sp. JCM 19039]|uniref:GNAT family N-acetyltransferase n=1 Tax=Geomicrobium sp. JCM 19039 TaxID=1460636 RepID=UPI00045F4658|nr:GNAT family N-acetyltransferase [Geomicrobium sp. JCM 19039]GAK11082.1 acetyltransferase, GNAT family [Geomicrobium sp. JCM 19039]